MARRRMGWDNLRPSTRERYEKKGVTRAMYDSGVSLKDARGHSKTPEHATGKIDRQKYPEYFAKRQQLIQQLEAKNQRMFGDRPRWDLQKNRDSIRQKPQSNAALIRALEASEEDIFYEIRGEETDYAYLFYYH